MYQEIYDVIKSKLPEEVGRTLRGALEQGERDKAAAMNLRELTDEYSATIAKKNKEIAEMEANVVTKKELEEKEAILKDAETKMVGFQIQEKYEAEKRVNEHLMKIQELLCKSATYRRSVQNFQDHSFDSQGVRQSAETGREEIVTEE